MLVQKLINHAITIVGHLTMWHDRRTKKDLHVNQSKGLDSDPNPGHHWTESPEAPGKLCVMVMTSLKTQNQRASEINR